MQLDTPTLFASLMIAEFAGSAILLLFYLYWPVKNLAVSRSLAMWSAGLFLAACGTVLIGLRGSLPDGLSVMAAHFLLILAIGLRRAGFAVFLGLRGHLWVFAIIATGWLVMSLFPAFSDSALFRMNYFQSCLILTGLWVVAMAFLENPDKLHTARLLGVTTLIECAAFALFTFNQNTLLFSSMLSAFPQGVMSVYLVALLISTIMSIVLAASLVVEKSSRQIEEKALLNDLTGLPVRSAFHDTAEEWIQENRETGKVYSLILFNMDELKSVSDKYSPAMADALLLLFARILKDTLDKAAVAGHFGNTEFAVFMPDANQELAQLTAQRLCRRFSLGCQEASGGKLTISVNVSLITAGVTGHQGQVSETAESGLEKADKKGSHEFIAVDLTPGGSPQKTADSSAFSTIRKKAA